MGYVTLIVLIVTIAALAFGYDKYYFSRLFNRNVGVQLNNYINMIRVQEVLYQSQRLPSVPLVELAFRNGFESETTFYRALKTYRNSP